MHSPISTSRSFPIATRWLTLAMIPIALVMIVIVAAIGVRPAILVGLAIPGSFLAGILFISWIGLTLNIVVLFSLILVVGMLVDGAIVTTELADTGGRH